MTILGITPIVNYPYGLWVFIKYTMLIGFLVYILEPLVVYFWSLKNGYMKAKNKTEIIKNCLIIPVTTIPFSLVATAPVIYAWFRGLEGWGPKTPRTDERHGTKEEEYLILLQRNNQRKLLVEIILLAIWLYSLLML